jgi:hypothetical protein
MLASSLFTCNASLRCPHGRACLCPLCAIRGWPLLEEDFLRASTSGRLMPLRRSWPSVSQVRGPAVLAWLAFHSTVCGPRRDMPRCGLPVAAEENPRFAQVRMGFASLQDTLERLILLVILHCGPCIDANGVFEVCMTGVVRTESGGGGGCAPPYRPWFCLLLAEVGLCRTWLPRARPTTYLLLWLSRAAPAASR